MIWINASMEKVQEEILGLQKRQNSGESWDLEVDGGRLAALERTAQRLRYQNAPLSQDVRAAQNKVSKVPVLSTKEAQLIANSG